MADNNFCPICSKMLPNRFTPCCITKQPPAEKIMEYKGRLEPENASELGHVLPKSDGDGITVHHVVTELTKELPKMDEIYVVTKDKDGEWLVSSKGTIGGIAHAVMLLHEYWNEQR